MHNISPLADRAHKRAAMSQRRFAWVGLLTILTLILSFFPQVTASAAGLPTQDRSAPSASAVQRSQAPQAIDAGPTPIQFFYLPLPEAQVKTAFQVITSMTGAAMTSVTSLSVTASNTVLYYDQWEDGYELDVTNPAQSSTKIWGDGNPGNGDVCPLVQPASLCSGDVLQPGAVIILRNDVPLPRNSAIQFYDARDKVSATKVVAMARSAWYANDNPGTMLADASEVYDTSRWGTDYRLPIGEDLNAMSTYMYEYVSLLVMASQDGTSVTIDKTGNGASGDDVTVTLNQGDAYQVSSATVGDLTSNGHVTSNKPIQVHLLTGDIGSNYEQRWYTLLPTDPAGSSYYTPVGTVSSSFPAAVFVYNPSQTTAITVNYQTQAGAGAFNVAAKGVYRFAMPSLSGAYFWTVNKAPFMAVGAMDTTTTSSAPTQNQTYDWGYTLVPETNLTTRFVVGWAPGTGDLPISGNGSPVWVMAVKPTTIYVDYDGNPATGPNTAPNGAKYDVSYTVAALASTRIYDPDKNQTGMRVFTTDGTLITGAWGEDPTKAAAGYPYLDVGYTVSPLPELVLDKTATLVVDANSDGKVGPGDMIEYSISITNRGVVKALGVIVQDTVPTNSAYVLNSTKVDNNAVSDDGSGTPFPLDGAGINIGDMNLGQTVKVTFRVTANPFPPIYDKIVNTATVHDQNDTYTVTVETPINPPAGTMCTMGFTDASYSPVSVYLVGDTVYVQVNDGDRNTNPSAADTVTVEVQNPATGDRETVTLTETGASTGVFRGSKPSSATAGQSVNDGTLYARGGDTITADYADPVNGDSCNASATITVPSLTKRLYLSDPGQALDRVDPVATNDTTASLSAVLSTGGGNVSDNFETGGFSGNSGTTNWTGSWTEVNEYDGAAAGALYVGDYVVSNGAYALQVRTGTSWGGQTAKSIYRQANLTGAPSATLTYNWKVGAAGGGSVGVYVSSDGGTSWALKKTHNLAANTSGSESIDITAYAASNTRIKFDIDSTTSSDAIIGFDDVTITYGDSGSSSAAWTQSPAMTSNFTMPAGSSIGVMAYVNVTAGTMPANPNITAVLKYGTTTLVTLTAPSYSGGILTWSGVLASGATVPAGQALVVEFTTAQSGVSFQVRYDSKDYPSRVSLPTTTVISLTSLGVYDAPYPGGNPVASPHPGQKVYVRVIATDPFGAADITSADLTLAGVPVTLSDTDAVASSGNTKTYERAWTTPGSAGSCAVNAVVKEGFETGSAAISDSASLPLECQFEDAGTPSVTEFTNGNNGPGTETYNPNQQVCVRVTDADQNQDPAVAETVTAVITSSSGDRETITLTETGPNTGIFTNCINASTTGGGGTNDGTLNAPPGATLVVTYTDPNDPSDTSNDTAVVTTPTPAMAIAKTRITPQDGVAVIGETVRFDIVVSNPGPTELTTVTVTDNFPSTCLSYQSASITPDNVGASTLTWNNIGPITTGSNKTISLYFTVIAACNPATNTAQATGKDQNNQSVSAGPASAQVVTTKPSVTVVKTLTSPVSGTAPVSSTVTFKIDITNNGTTAITSLPLTDQYSASCLEYVSATPTASGGGGGIVFWSNLGPLAAGNSTSVTVNFHVEGPCSPATNLAVVDSARDANGDPVPPATGSATVTTTAPAPAVTVIKTVIVPAGGAAYIGDPIQYQVEIKNTGVTDITDLTLTDTYDNACQLFVSASITPAGTSSGQVNWNPLIPTEPPLLAGTSKFLTLNFTATGAKASCLNTAIITGKDKFNQTFGPLSSQASVQIPLRLSGTVFDDANGSKTQNGSEPGINAGGLYVNLLDSNNKVVVWAAVNTNGTYDFPAVSPNAIYTLQLNQTGGTVGQAPPTVTLPAGWVTTGENSNGTPDATADSQLTAVVGTTDVTGQNFGIEQLPSSDDKSAASQLNPGGTVEVQAPALSGSDPEDGTLGTGDTFVIKSLPTNGMLYYNGSPVTLNQVITSYDPTKLTVDPNDGAVTVVFTYAAVDTAGKEDPTPATVTMPFGTLTISGTVWRDKNGSAAGTFNNIFTAGEVGTNAGGLYANLIGGDGKVIKSVPVNTDGTYVFIDLAGNQNGLTINLSTTAGTAGQTPPAAGIPAGWVNTSPLTQDPFNLISTSITGKDFGIEQPPDSDNKTAPAQKNPGGTVQVQVPALSGSDPEDGTLGTGSTFVIKTLPTNGTLYYNGTPVTSNQIITNYDPSKLTVDPNDGTPTVVFTYAAVDAAGQEDPTPATVTMPFTEAPSIGIAKAMQSSTNNGDGTFTVVYALNVKNLGDVVLNNVQVTDDLATAFAGATFTVDNVTSGGFAVNFPGYTGSSPNTNLLAAGNTLAVGATKTIILTVTVRPATSPATYSNQATATGVSPAGTPVTDLSDDGTVIDPDGDKNANEPGENDPTPVTLTQTPGIAVVKIGPAVSYVGETITYTYTVTNTGDVALNSVTVNDDRCAAPAYVSGDTNGNNKLDVTETWKFTCTHTVQANDPNPLVNHATAQGTPPLGGQPVTSPQVSWSVSLVIFTIGDMIWLDNGDGIQQPGETTGLYNVPVHIIGTDVHGNPVNVTVYTDVTGHYLYHPAAPGVYTASVPNIFSGYQTSSSNPLNFTLSTANPQNLNVDFGYVLPTGLSFLGFRAVPGPDGVKLTWQFRVDEGVEAPLFHVRRSVLGTDTWKQLTSELIAPASHAGQTWDYEYMDLLAQHGAAYLYELQMEDGTIIGPFEVRVFNGRVYLPLLHR